MKEADFVRRFRERARERYGDHFHFVKIPTGMFGGFRPFDAFAALYVPSSFPPGQPAAEIVHYALEFKVERDRNYTPEALAREFPHQWQSLMEASPFYVTAFALCHEKRKTLRFVPVGLDRKRWGPADQAPKLSLLECVWERKKASKTKPV